MNYPEAYFTGIHELLASLVSPVWSTRQAIVASLKDFFVNLLRSDGFLWQSGSARDTASQSSGLALGGRKRKLDHCMNCRQQCTKCTHKMCTDTHAGFSSLLWSWTPPLRDPLHQLWQMHYHAAVVVCLFLFRCFSTLRTRGNLGTHL